MPRPADSPEVKRIKEYRKRIDGLLRSYPVSDNRWVNGQIKGYIRQIEKLRIKVRAQGRERY